MFARQSLENLALDPAAIRESYMRLPRMDLDEKPPFEKDFHLEGACSRNGKRSSRVSKGNAFSH